MENCKLGITYCCFRTYLLWNILGLSVDENMQDQILQSRRTIALVSQNYLNSEYCIKELELAMSFNGGRRLVVVFLDESVLNQFMSISPMFKRYIQTFKYLDFDHGSPAFFKQLLKLLPQKESKSFKELWSKATIIYYLSLKNDIRSHLKHYKNCIEYCKIKYTIEHKKNFCKYNFSFKKGQIIRKKKYLNASNPLFSIEDITAVFYNLGSRCLLVSFKVFCQQLWRRRTQQMLKINPWCSSADITSCTLN